MRLLRFFVSCCLACATCVAYAQFATCNLANHALATGNEPLDFVRMSLRADGRPVLVYSTAVHNASSLHLFDCANPSCSAGHEVHLDDSFNYFGAPGIVVRADGRPLAVAEYQGGVRLYNCLDATCSEYGTSDIVPPSTGIFGDLPLVLAANGNPVLLYIDSPLSARPGQLIAHFCDDASCTTGTEQSLASPPANSGFSELSLALDGNGVPAATYLVSEGASNRYDYHIVRCADAACAGYTDTQLSAPTGTSIPSRTALALRSDRRPLALDSQADHRALLDCTASACATANDRPLPAAALGQPLGVKLLAGDRPAFGLFGSGSVGAFACSDAQCSDGDGLQAPSPTNAFLDGDFALDAGVRPALAYIDFDTRTLAVAGCDGDVLFVDGFD